MSPRAAARLESLGFTEVYDYVAGKADWLANGLPVAGERSGDIRAGDLARRDVPTCRLGDAVGDVLQSLDETGWDICVVVNDRRVVLGLLSRQQMERYPGALAGEIMDEGPTTTRLDTSPDGLRERIESGAAGHILVTTVSGELAGVVRGADLDRAAGGAEQ